MESVITKDDPVITAYRAHGWTYTRGIPPKEVLAELTGNITNNVSQYHIMYQVRALVVQEGKVALCTCMHQTSMVVMALLEHR